MNYFRYKQFNKCSRWLLSKICIELSWYIWNIKGTWCKRSSFNGLPLGSRICPNFISNLEEKASKSLLQMAYWWDVHQNKRKMELFILCHWCRGIYIRYLFGCVSNEIIIQHMRLSNVSLNNLVNLKR